ncbi:hypothetical protein Q5P01_026096 [Channa striata]|uniref:MARVEL domain-containing protein n=1 Tax=Channa striata TaxID=64152 RepID=A0AA88ITZ2_CHASR|nr:hypothetical protein Q5P01_026096 [Channa striata]
MPVIVLEARDFTSPLFLVRTLEVLTSCTTFSLVASLEPSELSKNVSIQNSNTFKLFSMFTWCFFFSLTLLIHILSVIQFHSLIPISWKNLTMTVAVLGALMCFSASLVFPWIVMDHQGITSRSVAAAVAACLTFMAYSSESYILHTQTHDQRGYMGSMPGLLKILQLWGSCQSQSLLSTACASHRALGASRYVELGIGPKRYRSRRREAPILWNFGVSFEKKHMKPPEHHGHVKLDSALGRCRSQAGLNGTEDTRL